MLKDKAELHLARCVPKTFQLEAPMEPRKVLQSMLACATRSTEIVDVDTCHDQDGKPKATNGELSDISDDASKESGKTKLNEIVNEGDEIGVACTVNV